MKEWFFVRYNAYNYGEVGSDSKRTKRLAIQGRQHVGRYVASLVDTDLSSTDKTAMSDFLEGRIDHVMVTVHLTSFFEYGIVSVEALSCPPLSE